MKSFSQELKNRRVYRTAIGYAVAASAVVQLAGTVLPAFHAADWIQQVLVVLLALGFPVALVFAWVFEVQGGAITRTRALGGSRSLANRRRLWMLATVGLAVAAIVSAGYWFWHPWTKTAPRPTNSGLANPADVPEKSIAVLPFENLSDTRQNAFFAEGVQDEILNDLSKIADLKVISRTSVMPYRGGASRNLREIGQQLGVAHVIEGSVQRDGKRVRVNAQLIDARTDAHLWGETYDRDLADVFQIQTEIARAIVAQLQAKLSPQEKAGLAERPTPDLATYDLYLRAKDIVNSYLNAEDPRESLLQAVRLLREATTRDPDFVLAYSYESRAHALLYFLNLDATPARRRFARAAVDTALRLRPGAEGAGNCPADSAQQYAFFCACWLHQSPAGTLDGSGS